MPIQASYPESCRPGRTKTCCKQPWQDCRRGSGLWRPPAKLFRIYQSQSQRPPTTSTVLETVDRSSYSHLHQHPGISISWKTWSWYVSKCPVWEISQNQHKEEDAESPAVIKNPCHPLSMMKKHEKLTFTNTLSRRGSIGARASRARIFKQVQRSSSMGNSLSKPCKYVRISWLNSKSSPRTCLFGRGPTLKRIFILRTTLA